MTDPIVRMYETEQQAHDTATRLREEGFPEDGIFLVVPESGSDGGSSEALASAFMAGHVLRSHADIYAQGLKGGRSLVAARAPFGFGQLATQIMDSFGPVDLGLRPPQRSSMGWDEAAPLSSALQLRVLRHRQPAPFSELLGLPVLSRGRSFLSNLFGELASPKPSLFGHDALIQKAAPFSSLFGLGLLSRNPAPLSSLFGLQTVYASAGPWTSSFGLPLLSRAPAPFSSLFGLPLLTR